MLLGLLFAASLLFAVAVLTWAISNLRPRGDGEPEWVSEHQPSHPPALSPPTKSPSGVIGSTVGPRPPVAEPCPVKGIAWPDGARFYLVPNDYEYYEHMIDRKRGDRCFNSEEEALRAGWRRPKGADVRAF
jgi:hypothetical protein